MKQVTLPLILLWVAVACNPSPEKLHQEASKLIDLNKFQEARILLDSIINTGPPTGNVYAMRAECNFQLKAYELTVRDCDEAIALGKTKDSKLYFYRGMANHLLNQHDPAIEDLTMAITINADYAEAFHYRGDAWMATGLADSAVLDFNRAIEKNPKLAPPYFSLGEFFLNSSSYDQALTYFSQAIELEPKAEYLYNRGLVYYRENELENALNDFSYAIILNGQLTDSYTMRGIIRDELGRGVEALADFDEAIKGDPENGYIYFNRGITRKNLGDLKGACEDFNRALDLGYLEAIAKTGDCQS